MNYKERIKFSLMIVFIGFILVALTTLLKSEAPVVYLQSTSRFISLFNMMLGLFTTGFISTFFV